MNNDKKYLPLISCLCPTFARPSLLEEAVQSFLIQDYKGEKELIILNDFSAQTLTLDHPEISVVNLPKKVSTLGDKRNILAILSKGSVLFPWDDDDIHLSFRVSQSVNYLLENKTDYYKPETAFGWDNGTIAGIGENNFHAQCCYTRDIFEKAFYSSMGSGEDQDFDRKIEKLLNTKISTSVSPDKNFYIYRWEGTNSYHLSELDRETGEDIIAAQYDEAARRKAIPTGTIELEPKWKLNYEKQAQEFISSTYYKI